MVNKNKPLTVANIVATAGTFGLSTSVFKLLACGSSGSDGSRGGGSFLPGIQQSSRMHLSLPSLPGSTVDIELLLLPVEADALCANEVLDKRYSNRTRTVRLRLTVLTAA